MRVWEDGVRGGPERGVMKGADLKSWEKPRRSLASKERSLVALVRAIAESGRVGCGEEAVEERGRLDGFSAAEMLSALLSTLPHARI